MSEQDPTTVTPGITDATDRSVPIPARPRPREQKPLGLSAAMRPAPAENPPPTSASGAGVPSLGATPAPAVPKHQRLNRRVVFLTDTQETGLAELTRQLMSDPRRKLVPGAARERISDAVLVRTAIDLMLRDHAKSLGCMTEDDLRASVGLPALGT